MAPIDTLVQDIYRLFDAGGVEPTDEQLEAFSKSVTSSIRNSFRYKPNESRGLRMSALGKPERQETFQRRVNLMGLVTD